MVVLANFMRFSSRLVMHFRFSLIQNLNLSPSHFQIWTCCHCRCQSRYWQIQSHSSSHFRSRFSWIHYRYQIHFSMSLHFYSTLPIYP